MLRGWVSWRAPWLNVPLITCDPPSICLTWLSGLFTVKNPTQTMTSCSNPSQVCWEQYPSRELIMCLKARDSPSAPTIDWKTARNTHYIPAVSSRTCVSCVHINCTSWGLSAKCRPCSLLWKAEPDLFFQLQYNIKSHRSKNKFKFPAKAGFCLFDIQCSIRLTIPFDIHYMLQENVVISFRNKQKKPNHLHFCISH